MARRFQTAARLVATIAILLSACGKSTTQSVGGTTPPAPPATTAPPTTPSAGASQSTLPRQKPVPAESNPPGDIPDTTAFVPYHSAAGGFTLSVPEGWARVTKSSSVNFSSALNSVTVAWTKASSAPTVASARANDVPALQQSRLAFRLQSVQKVTLQGGPAVEIVYEVNSAQNPVTGKQYRLEIERFELYKGGTLANLDLSSPVGADNVDPWHTVSESFRWL